MPAGRPSEYHPIYGEKVIELGKLGKSKAQIAASLGISRQTWYRWIDEHAEFSDAVKEAEFLCLSWWEDKGQEGLKGGELNATAFIFQMKNRFRDDYRDKIETENKHEGNLGFTVIERRIVRPKRD